MKNMIFDAGVVAAVCLTTNRPQSTADLLDSIHRSERRIWIYTAQIKEVLEQLENRLMAAGENNVANAARNLFRSFSNDCSWLSSLSEDGLGLSDPDPVAAGLQMAARRLGKRTTIVTDCASRLERGLPFVDIETACNEVVAETSVAFIDLDSQQDRIRSKLERNLFNVLYHGRYVMGTEIETLESQLADYVGVEHCVCVSSGTDALLIALMSLDIGPGDEVVISPFTFFAVAETIKLLGATLVYVDIDAQSYTLNADLLEAAITDRTRVVLPVSLYGQCGDMDRINEITASHQLSVIEDGAQSFGATYKERRSCGLSRIGCTSFFPAKPLGAYGDGGACFTQEREIAESMRQIRDHGQSGRYQHARIGINGRMDTLQAAVLLSKLEIFDDELLERARVAERYSNFLKECEQTGKLQLPVLEEHNFSSWAQYTVEVDDRDQIQKKLDSKGIPTAIHYPLPVYAQPALWESVTHCPVTERAAQRVLGLPMHPYISSETQKSISRAVIEAIGL